MSLEKGPDEHFSDRRERLNPVFSRFDACLLNASGGLWIHDCLWWTLWIHDCLWWTLDVSRVHVLDQGK